MAQAEQLYVGIDLGNTYSSIAHYDEGGVATKVSILEEPHGSEQIPTYICYVQTDEEINIEYGTRAKGKDNEKTKLFAPKLLVAKRYDDITDDEKSILQYIRCGTGRNGMATMEITLNNEIHSFLPEEVISLFLNKLIKLLPQDKKIAQLCLTVPVDFNDEQKRSLIRACLILGIEREKISLIHEPVASVLAYQQEDPKDELKVGNKVLVVDFGGGTLDVCCCEIEQNPDYPDDPKRNIIRTKANGGVKNLGGLNFDQVLTELIKQLFEEKLINDGYNPEDYIINENDPEGVKKVKRRKINKFNKSIEETKKLLTNEAKVFIDPVDFIDGFTSDKEYILKITREEYEQAINEVGLLNRMMDIITQTMNKEENGKEKWNPEDVNNILFIGGTCKIPIVRDTLKDYFKTNKIKKYSRNNFHSEKAVVKGATIHAFRMGENSITVKDTLPYSMFAKINDNPQMILIYREGQELPSTSRINKNDFPITNNNNIQFSNEYNIQIYRNTHLRDKYIFIDEISTCIPYELNSFNIEFTVDTSGVSKVQLLDEHNNEIPDVKQLTTQLDLQDEMNLTMTKHLSKYDRDFEDHFNNLKDHFNLNKRVFNTSKHPVGMYFGDNYIYVYFNHLLANKPKEMEFETSWTVCNSCIQVSINTNNQQEMVLGVNEGNVLKLYDIEKYLKEASNEPIGVLYEGNENERIDVNINDIFPFVLHQIHKRFKNIVSYLGISNMIITIPHCFEDEMKNYLLDSVDKYSIFEVELIHESYAAMIWFNYENKGVLQTGNKVKVINFRENCLEIDVIQIEEKIDIIEIEEKINKFVIKPNVITKTTRNQPIINHEMKMTQIDDIIYEIMMTKIKEAWELNDCDSELGTFNDYYVMKKDDDERTIARKISRKESLRNKIYDIKKELFKNDKKSSYEFKLSLRIDIDLELSIGKDEIEQLIEEQMSKNIMTLIQENEERADQVIVIIEEINQNIIKQHIVKALTEQHVPENNIHFMTSHDIGKGACQRAYEIHTYNKSLNIEQEIEFKYQFD